MKEYLPQKKAVSTSFLIASSRYKVLFGKLEPDKQKRVLVNMMQLVEEEREYCDKGRSNLFACLSKNYGHLCNILTTIALDEVLQADGLSADDAYKLISESMWAALYPKPIQKLARMPFFLPLMRRLVPIGFRYGSGKGWRYTWFKNEPRNVFRFECNECLYKTIFQRRGLLERFGPMFCHSDIIRSTSGRFARRRTTEIYPILISSVRIQEVFVAVLVALKIVIDDVLCWAKRPSAERASMYR